MARRLQEFLVTFSLLILVFSIINVSVGFALSRFLQQRPVEDGELEIKLSVGGTQPAEESTKAATGVPKQSSSVDESAANDTAAVAASQEAEPKVSAPETEPTMRGALAEPELDDIIPPEVAAAEAAPEAEESESPEPVAAAESDDAATEEPVQAESKVETPADSTAEATPEPESTDELAGTDDDASDTTKAPPAGLADDDTTTPAAAPAAEDAV